MMFVPRPIIASTMAILMVSTALFLVPEVRGNGETGIISGRVFDSVSLVALSAVMIILDGNSTVWMSDHYGDYAIPEVPFGVHRLRAYIDGYDPRSYEVNLTGASLTQDIYLEPSTAPMMGALKGSVRLERTYGSTDAGDAVVVVQDLDRPTAEMVLGVAGEGFIGEYFASVLPGNYSLQGLAFGHVPSAKTMVRAWAGKVSYTDLLLRSTSGEGTVLEGTVRDGSNGASIGNATVVAHCLDDGTTYIGSTGMTGEYFFSGTSEGDYTIVAFGPGYLAGSAVGEIVEGSPTVVDLDLLNGPLPPENSTVVWGMVRIGGVPASDGWAFISSGQQMGAELFGVEGLYMFDGAGAGMRMVSAWSPEHYVERVDLEVTAGSTVRHDFDLGPMANTSVGTSLVLVRVTESSPGEPPLGGASVTLYRSDVSTGQVVFSTTIDMPDDGSTGVIFPVPSDSGYRVRAVLSGHSFRNFTVGGRPEALQPGDPFIVLGQRLNALELRMTSFGIGGGDNSTIWGFACAGALDGQPVPGAAVFLDRGQGLLAFTDGSGAYEFRVPPGDVDLMAAYPGSYGHSAYDHSSGQWQIGDFQGTLAPGETRRVDLVFQKRNTEHSTIAGRVVDRASGAGLEGFGISIRTSQTAMPEQTTGEGGFFHFTPITDLFRTWRVIGRLPGYQVVRVDWRVVPDGATTTGIDFPFELDVPVSSLVWIDIYVDKVPEEDLDMATLWGYVLSSSTTGAPVNGAMISLSPMGSGQNYTDQDGLYSFKLAPGDYELNAIVPGISSMYVHDTVSGSWSQGPWSGALATGEDRRVDVVVTTGGSGSSTIAGRVLRSSDLSPVDGFYLKAWTTSITLPSVRSDKGRFIFSPLTSLDEEWTVTGEGPDLLVSRVEYRVLPDLTPEVMSDLPMTFQLLAGTVLWMDIYVNASASVKDGQVVGQVLEPYSYGPLEGVTVLVTSDLDRTENVMRAVTGTDGTFEVSMPPGSYTLRFVLEGYTVLSASIMLTNGQELTQRFFMVPGNGSDGRATLLRFVDSVKGTPVKELKVQIGGLGQFLSDEDGQVMVRVPFAGNYSFTVSGSIAQIESVSAGNMTIGDGTMYLTPGDEYVLYMRPYVQVSAEEGSRLDEPLLIGLIAGILIALVLGVIVGLILSRRPKEVMFFEE